MIFNDLFKSWKGCKKVDQLLERRFKESRRLQDGQKDLGWYRDLQYYLANNVIKMVTENGFIADSQSNPTFVSQLVEADAKDILFKLEH